MKYQVFENNTPADVSFHGFWELSDPRNHHLIKGRETSIFDTFQEAVDYVPYWLSWPFETVIVQKFEPNIS